MTVSTENITDMLKNVVELLNLEDESKVDLAIDILMLVINYIGAEKIMDTIDDALGDALTYTTDYIGVMGSDLSAEQREKRLAQTRSELDMLFAKLSAVKDVRVQNLI